MKTAAIFLASECSFCHGKNMPAITPLHKDSSQGAVTPSMEGRSLCPECNGEGGIARCQWIEAVVRKGREVENSYLDGVMGRSDKRVSEDEWNEMREVLNVIWQATHGSGSTYNFYEFSKGNWERVFKSQLCQRCQGTGFFDPAWTPCPRCAGQGKKSKISKRSSVGTDGGLGAVWFEEHYYACSDCDGWGYVSPKRLEDIRREDEAKRREQRWISLKAKAKLVAKTGLAGGGVYAAIKLWSFFAH